MLSVPKKGASALKFFHCRSFQTKNSILRFPRQIRPKISDIDPVYDRLKEYANNQATSEDPVPDPKVKDETQDWMAFVSERTVPKNERDFSEVLSDKTAAGEKYAWTLFGSIRTDDMNPVKHHGQQDKFIEAHEKLQQTGETGDDGDVGLDDVRQKFMSKAISAKFASQNTCRDFFFESEEQRPKIRDYQQEKATDDLVPNCQDFKFGKFSFRPSHLSRSFNLPKQGMETLAPNFDGSKLANDVDSKEDFLDNKEDLSNKKVDFSVGKVNSLANEEELGPVDEQYFSTVNHPAPVHHALPNSLHQNSETSHSEKDLSDLGTIDQQYFKQLNHVDIDVPTDPIDTSEMKELMKDSTTDLSYIDSQMFPDFHHTEKNPNVAQKKQNWTENNKIKTEVKSKVSTNQPKPDGKSLTLEEFKAPKTGTALAFVKNLRALEKTKTPAPQSKEKLVGDLGVSLMHKMERIAPKDQLSIASTADEPVESNEMFHGSLQDKFKPVKLFKLNSYDVINMLINGVVYNDNDIIALNKPYDLPMSCENKDPHSVLKYLPQLADEFGVSKLHTVHRLDKVTSGILLLAKTSDMSKTLARLFRKRLVDKRYWAIVRGIPKPSEGIINIPIGKIELNENRYRITVLPDYSQSSVITNKKRSRLEAFPAVTEYKTLKTRFETSLVEIKPITGFKNQIRVHMSFGINCPVLGDHKFTNIKEVSTPQKIGGQTLRRFQIRQSKARDLPVFLHAKHIQLPDIVPGKQVWIDAPLSHHFNRAMKTLKLKPDRFVSI